jgi:hypothetical protein
LSGEIKGNRVRISGYEDWKIGDGWLDCRVKRDQRQIWATVDQGIVLCLETHFEYRLGRLEEFKHLASAAASNGSATHSSSSMEFAKKKRRLAVP